MDSEQANFCPIKFLNSLDSPGMPPHKLELKIGSPVLLLRNIDTQRLCNGTRLCVKQYMLVLTWKLHEFRKDFSHLCWLKELARQIICILCSNWKNKQYCILESIKKNHSTIKYKTFDFLNVSKLYIYLYIYSVNKSMTETLTSNEC